MATTQGTPDRWARQTLIGTSLAAAIAGGWLVLHVSTLFLLPWSVALALAPALIVLQCWLSVGLFIVAHDAMHGSLAPGRPGLNRAIGRLALLLYAGIWYDAIVARHFAHHGAPGTADDPDFAGDGRVGVWRWYAAFFLEYVSLGQILRIGFVMTADAMLFGVAPARLLLFWAVPSLLASLQLFVFGTYLPHRREEGAFPDRHRARSNDYGWLVSLASCFHFGYHHEHHTDPSVPWWRLPAVHAGRRAAGIARVDRA